MAWPGHASPSGPKGRIALHAPTPHRLGCRGMGLEGGADAACGTGLAPLPGPLRRRPRARLSGLRQILHRCHRPAGPLRLGCSSSGGIDAARLVRLRGVARAAMRRPPRRALVIVVPPPPGPGLPRAPGDARRRVALSVAPEVRLGGDAPECAAARARLGHQVLVLGHALDRQLVRLNLGLRLELSRRLRVADPG